MNKKLLIIITMIFLAVGAASVVVVSGENTFLKCKKPEITAGEIAEFQVDFAAISEEEYGQYSMKLSVEPQDAPICLKVNEDIDVTINNTKKTCVISYEALSYFESLNFTLKPEGILEEDTEYTIKCEITGESKTAEEEMTITVKHAVPDETKPTKPAKPQEPPKKPEFVDGGGGGSVDGETEENPYKGSSDNYLSSLKVAGYELEQSFHKTRDTYFVKVKSGTTHLDVSATACAKSAKINIVGNDQITGDESKILINVTAENGDERVYRIYVLEKEGSDNEKN